MKFIKELIANKSWSGKSDELEKDDLMKDLEDGNFPSPLVERQSEKSAQEWDEFNSPEFADLHPDAQTSDAATADDVTASVMDDEKSKAWLEDFDALEDEDDDDWLSADDEDDDEDWDLGPSEAFNDQPTDANIARTRPRTERSVSVLRAVSVPPPANENFGQDELEEDLDDETYSDAVGEAAIEAVMAKEDLSEVERAALVEEIQEAMSSVKHVRSDEELGRQAAAREQLGLGADAGPNSRILDETNTILNEDKGARRRQAIALLKNVAAATKTDPVLQNMAGHDASSDRTAQDSYREDLASFVDKEHDPSLIRRAKSKTRDAEDIMDDDALVAADTSDPFAGAEPPKWAAEAVAAEAPEDTPEEPTKTGAERVASQNRVDNLRAALMSQPRSQEIPQDQGYVDETDNIPTSAADDDLNAEPQPEPVAKDDGQSDPIADISDALSGLSDVIAPKPTPDIAPASTNANQLDPAAAPVGRAGRQAGRVKTRLLGFQSAAGPETELFNKPTEPARADASGPTMFPLGWIVVVDGPGRGASFALTNGVCQIGRSLDQAVALAFGDNSISRENHAAIAYDDEQNKFFLGHGGKSNLVRLNGKPVLSTEELVNADQIRLGETTLKFVALCAGDFNWLQTEGGDDGKAAIA